MTAFQLLLVSSSVLSLAFSTKFIQPSKNEEVVVKVGEPLTLNCSTDTKVIVCQWMNNNNPIVVTATGSSEYRLIQTSENSCNVRIEKVVDQHHGIWTCSPITEDVSGTVAKSHEISVVVAKPPAWFGIISKENIVSQDNQSISVMCEARDSRPAASLTWLLGSDPEAVPITDKDKVYETIVTNALNKSGNGNTMTVTSRLTYRFTPQDNGGKLRCQAVHRALEKPMEDSRTVEVFFGPLFAEDAERRMYFHPGKDALLALNFSSNPAPQSVEWHVDSTVISEYRNPNRSKYVVKSIQKLDKDKYQAALLISSIGQQDARNYILRVIGAKTQDFPFQVLLGNRPLAGGQSSVSVSEAGNLPEGAVVGIVIAVVVLLLLVLVLVVARRRRSLCFNAPPAGNQEEVPPPDGGGPEGGSAKPKRHPARAIFRAAFVKRPPAAAAAATAATTTATTALGPARPDRKRRSPPDGGEETWRLVRDEKVVYAELDLGAGREGPAGRRGDEPDKTEYAEIVGTLKTATVENGL